MDWNSIPLLENHVMLLKHGNYIYKIKLKYKNLTEEIKAALLDIVSESASQQIKDVLRAVFYRLDKNIVQSPIQSEHFLFYPQVCPWPLGQKVMFTVRGQCFRSYPQLILLNIVCKGESVSKNQTDEFVRIRLLEQKQQVQTTSIQSPKLLSDMHNLGSENQNTASSPVEMAFPQSRVASVPTPASMRTSIVNNAMLKSQKIKEDDVSSNLKGRKSITKPFNNSLHIANSPVNSQAQLKQDNCYAKSRHEDAQEDLIRACPNYSDTKVTENNGVILAHQSPKTTLESKTPKHSNTHLKNFTHDATTKSDDIQVCLRRKINNLRLEEKYILPKNNQERKKRLATLKDEYKARRRALPDVSFDMSDNDVVEISDEGSRVYVSESIEGNNEGADDAQSHNQGWDKEGVSDSQGVHFPGPIRLRRKIPKKQSSEDEVDSVLTSDTNGSVKRRQCKYNLRPTNTLNVRSPPKKRKFPRIPPGLLDLDEMVSKRQGSVVKSNETVFNFIESHYNKQKRPKNATNLSRPESHVLKDDNQLSDEDKEVESPSQSLSSIYSPRSSESPNSSLSQVSDQSLNDSQSSSSPSSQNQPGGRRHNKPFWMSKDDVWVFSSAPKVLCKLRSKVKKSKHRK